MLEPMKIVICDDSIEDLIKIEKFLQKYLQLYTEINMETEKFSDPSRLYDKICHKELADIYILDMIMSEKTGIDIGSLLGRSEKKAILSKLPLQMILHWRLMGYMRRAIC